MRNYFVERPIPTVLGQPVLRLERSIIELVRQRQSSGNPESCLAREMRPLRLSRSRRVRVADLSKESVALSLEY